MQSNIQGSVLLMEKGEVVRVAGDLDKKIRRWIQQNVMKQKGQTVWYGFKIYVQPNPDVFHLEFEIRTVGSHVVEYDRDSNVKKGLERMLARTQSQIQSPIPTLLPTSFLLPPLKVASL